MVNSGSYVDQFTKLQKIKTDLFKHNKQSEYSEDLHHFKTTKLTVRKKKYLDTKDRRQRLTTKLVGLHTRFLSMKQLYIKSRSNTFENDLKQLFDDMDRTTTELAKLDSTESMFLDVSEKGAREEKNEEPEKKELSPSKKKSIKKFLFNTYDQCVSQKTKEPTYMSKADIIKHIKEHDPTLLNHLPKSITSMKKDAICKVIFP
jgi:hypothetical protein